MTIQVPRTTFPHPIVKTAPPPPFRCRCTWVWSPVTYGTPEEPYVLKVYYALCPVGNHARMAMRNT